jgi:hypothetical protein
LKLNSTLPLASSKRPTRRSTTSPAGIAAWDVLPSNHAAVPKWIPGVPLWRIRFFLPFFSYSDVFIYRKVA